MIPSTDQTCPAGKFTLYGCCFSSVAGCRRLEKSPPLAKGNSPPKPPRKDEKDQVMMRM